MVKIRAKWIAFGLPLALFLALLLPMLAMRAFLPVPFDWGEGWNAYHAAAAMEGRPLYPPIQSMMFDNYTPLSFYFVGLAGLLAGDNIVAGRLVSILLLLVLGAGVAASLRALGTRRAPALFGALFCMTQIAIFSDFVGVNAPQLLAHAIAIWGFLLLVRQPSDPAAQLGGVLLLSLGFFTKHMLIAQPLALVLWLAWWDRKVAARLALTGLALLAVGLTACVLLLDADITRDLLAPRDYDMDRFGADLLHWFYTNALPLLLIAITLLPSRDRRTALPLLYLVIAMAIGVCFHGARGVLSNAMYDANIALALCIGLAVERLWDRLSAPFLGLVLMAAILAQGVTFAEDWPDKWRPVVYLDYAKPLAETRRGVAMLRSVHGPVMCDLLALCYWAGKSDPVDMFNLPMAWRHGGADARDMAKRIAARHYAMIQIGDQREFFLIPPVRAALGNYRVLYRDANGDFMIPKTP